MIIKVTIYLFTEVYSITAVVVIHITLREGIKLPRVTMFYFLSLDLEAITRKSTLTLLYHL